MKHLAIIALVLSSFVAQAQEIPVFSRKTPTLKELVPFRLGVAVSTPQVEALGSGSRKEKLIARHFNQVVAENCMKSFALQPREGEFHFDEADKFVDWARANNLAVVGHVLVWHSQLPVWFAKNADGSLCSRETLLARMENHIKTVVAHFKGRVYAWDVVNEAIEADGSYRRNDFFKILGEEYIDAAFKFANEADPDIQLWYNDYGNESAAKNATIAALVRRLKDSGLRIDGVGLQTHVRIDEPSVDAYEDAIKTISAEGVKLAITELDVSVLPAAWNLSAEISSRAAYDAKFNPWPEGRLPDDVNGRLGERYRELFLLFRRYSSIIERVTFWGLSDGDSWLNDFPMAGRTDYPLLFDRSLRLKPWARRALAGQKLRDR